MKSLTLHAMDEHLASRIKRRADEMSLSMNELAKQLLAEALGIKAAPLGRHRQEFEAFCGTWRKTDLQEFVKRTADLEKVQAEDWQ